MISASTIVATAKDALMSMRMNFVLSRRRGQCYNSAIIMMGARSGVVKQLSEEENQAVFLHRYMAPL